MEKPDCNKFIVMTSNQTSHAVIAPSQRTTPIDTLKKEMVGDYQKQVVNYFNGDKEKAMRFMSAAVYSVQKNPKLLECDKTSLLQAFMSCAEFQLFPSNVAGEAFIIPYKGKAQFQLGYQGIITLIWRAGINVRSQIVYEDDEFHYEEGLNSQLIHKPNIFKKNRGKAIGVYAVATLNNGQQVHQVLSADDVLAFKEFSQAKGSEFSPWNSKSDPELWMWRKTCIKQLAKTLPKTEILHKAIAKDNEESTIQKASLDALGPATGKALHVPDEPTEEVIDTSDIV